MTFGKEHGDMPVRFLFVATALMAGLSMPAAAGGVDEFQQVAGGVLDTRDSRVYADAYGNLVIDSQAGFKRILVGRGHLADDYAELGIETPRTAYLDQRSGRLHPRRSVPCSTGVLIKGRSYMYGLEDGVLPVLVNPCR